MIACEIVPFLGQAGVCRRCGTKLTGRRTAWCSDECDAEWGRNHFWTTARYAAVHRDGGRCVRCGGDGSPRLWPLNPHDTMRLGLVVPLGETVYRVLRQPWLEVNHIVPRVGRGYGAGCHHHLSNLETLCHPCHVSETTRQGRERRLVTKLAAPGTLFDEVVM